VPLNPVIKVGLSRARVSGGRFDLLESLLDSISSNVEQKHFKKIYRAKHAKLAKAPPTRPVYYQIISWRPWRSLREKQSFPICLSSVKFKYVWLDFILAFLGTGLSKNKLVIKPDQPSS
jgi:hypothetical protein